MAAAAAHHHHNAGGGGKPPNMTKGGGRPPPPHSQVLQSAKRRINRHGQQQRYFGRMSSNVTDHLKKVVPSHAFNPSLLRLPVPSYHRKASSISDYIERQVRPPPQPRRPYTAPDVYFGRRASNVTDHLRYIPPAHLGLNAHTKSLPYFGRLATSVTDPSKYESADGEDPITSHWSAGSRPSSARLPIPPQHVNKDVLFTALSARGHHPPCSGRRPTHIGSLLKHQFAHLLDPATASGASDKHSIKAVGDNAAPTSARAKRPDTAPAAPNTKRGHHSHPSASPLEQQLSIINSPRVKDLHLSQASPRPVSARSSLCGSEKRAASKPFMNGSKQSNVEPSPRRRPAHEGKMSTGRTLQEAEASRNGKNAEEASISSGMQLRDGMQEAGITHEGRDIAARGGEEDMEMEEGLPQHTEEAGRARSTYCMGLDDASSEVTEELGPEKLEFVSKWVQQEDRPHMNSEWTGQMKDQERLKAWPKPIDNVVDHSRRATSITKYNVW